MIQTVAKSPIRTATTMKRDVWCGSPAELASPQESQLHREFRLHKAYWAFAADDPKAGPLAIELCS
ncbi:MAG: hypothetical protein ACUVWX_13295, partial [Kiritimatiellia bacterium]